MMSKVLNGSIVNVLNVTMPLGIGDCHWACTKLRSLSKYHDDAKINVHVKGEKGSEFLSLIPFVNRTIVNNKALGGLRGDMSPHHREPVWSTLEGCRNWRGFDYILCPNGHLEVGKHLTEWLPELETDLDYPLGISAEAYKTAYDLVGKDPVVLYFAGGGPNKNFHGNTWKVSDWAGVIERLNSIGVIPYVVGAPYDASYAAKVDNYTTGKFHNVVGKTSVEEVMAVLDIARCVTGFNAGIPIMSAVMKTPTLMLWINSDHKGLPGVGDHVYLHPDMQYSWLTEKQKKTYRTLSFGSEELTPENVFNIIMELMEM